MFVTPECLISVLDATEYCQDNYQSGLAEFTHSFMQFLGHCSMAIILFCAADMGSYNDFTLDNIVVLNLI